MSHMHQWFYALSCVFVPVVWGLLMVWVTGRAESLVRRRATKDAGDGAAKADTSDVSPEYHI